MPIQSTRFSIKVGLLLLLPLMALGGRWLWEHGWLFYGTGVLTASFFLLTSLLRWRSNQTKALVFQVLTFPPNPNWTDTAHLPGR